MKVKIENQGNAELRVIVDRDTVNDSKLEAAEAEVYETEPQGIIELRELGEEEQ